jgi:hypothetical protein
MCWKIERGKEGDGGEIVEKGELRNYLEEVKEGRRIYGRDDEDGARGCILYMVFFEGWKISM